MKKALKVLGTSILVLSLLTSCGGDSSADSGFDMSKEIQVVTREDGSGTRGAFIELTGVEVKDAEGNKQDMTYEEAIIGNKTDMIMTTVAGNDYAIGYISVGALNDTVKMISVDGVEPTAENVNDGSYVIARPFNIATKGERSELTQDFINFMHSVEGQKISGNDYIAVSEGIEYSPSGLSGTIAVGGSTSVAPLMEEMKEAYEAINPDVTVEIQSLGSTAGMTGAMEGTFDIGMASRNLKDSEMAELDYEAIAKDAIGIVVNKNNTVVDDITLEEVRQIFTGETTEWSEVQ